MSTPIVAMVGATGYVGSFLTNAFLDALQGSRLRELRVLTSKKSDKTEKFQTRGAKIFEINFAKKETLLEALKSVDIVISAMGVSAGILSNQDTLLEAIVQCGVDVYFVSEFGVNQFHPRFKLTGDSFEGKTKHFNDASSKSGLKTIRLHCSLIMEAAFGKWCGLDCEAGVWTIPGDGNTPIAVTGFQDIGRGAVEAALMAFKNPASVPNALEFYGEKKTLLEYAAAFEAVSGEKIKMKFVSLDDALAKYEKTKVIYEIFPLLYATGACNIDPNDANGNDLLNPGEANWRWKRIEDFAQETGGKPVVHY